MTMLHRSFDLRSLALLRILLGLYIVWDVISRLKYPRWSLLWYIEDGFLAPGDSPHQSPVHRLWFFRGNKIFTIVMFAITVSLACMFAVGYHCQGLLKFALWLSVVAMQSKNMAVHDGSDTFLRHILLWCIQIPVARVWSLDSKKQREYREHDYRISSVACWGLALQIVLMYEGTVLNRTLDQYSISELKKSTWMPPSLTAIHYCLSGTFAVRKNWATDWVRNSLEVSRAITLVAMLTESLAPLACLLLASSIAPFILFQMHLGMLITTNLPNWQFMGMLSTVFWIPTGFWNCVQIHSGGGASSVNDGDHKQTSILKKTDEIAKSPLRGKISRSITCFLLTYMVYNWCGERGWIPKHDDGDIGEFMRFSQHWVMYGIPPFSSVNTIVLGRRVGGKYEDVWKTIRGEQAPLLDQTGYEQRRRQVWYNMTHLYPSPRWERALDQWGSRRDIPRARRLLEVLCRRHGNDWPEVELVWQHLRVMPPGNLERFERLPHDTIVSVSCEKDAEAQQDGLKEPAEDEL